MQALIQKFKRYPYVLLILATFFWGTNFAFSRMIVEVIPPIQLSFLRWVIASLVFLPFVLTELKEHHAVLRKQWKILFMLGLTGVAGFNTLIYIAMQYTTSINASLVNSLTPLFIVLLSVVFLREKLVRLQYIGTALSLIGVLVVLTEGEMLLLFSLTFNPGDLIVLAAVTLWAVYSVLMKKYGGPLPKKATFLVTMYIAIISLFPFSLFERTYHPISISDVPIEVLLAVVYLAIGPGIIAFICWNEGVMQVGPGKASNYLYLVLFFTTVLAVFFGGEQLGLPQIIGAVFVLTGVIITSNSKRHVAKKESKRKYARKGKWAFL